MNTPPAFRASANILPCRAVKISGNFTVAECDANERAIGISRAPSNQPPLSDLVSTNYAAASGQPVGIIGDGEIGYAEAGGSFSAGARLKSDADGKLVAVAGSGAEHQVAIALEDGASGSFVHVQVQLAQIYN